MRMIALYQQPLDRIVSRNNVRQDVTRLGQYEKQIQA